MVSERVTVAAHMLRWAITRSGRGIDAATAAFPQLQRWLNGELSPTVRQFKDFATWTRTPAPLLMLTTPPPIGLPIADFRIGRGDPAPTPSTELIDTIQIDGEDAHGFVLTRTTSGVEVAQTQWWVEHGDRLYVATFSTAKSQQEASEPIMDEILSTWSWQS